MLSKENDEDTQKDNYLFFRFAAWVLVLDPWIYVLLRREIISSVCAFCTRQERPHLTSSEDKMEEKSLQNNQYKTSYGTIWLCNRFYESFSVSIKISLILLDMTIAGYNHNWISPVLLKCDLIPSYRIWHQNS